MEINKDVINLFEKAREKLATAKAPKYKYVAWVSEKLYKKYQKHFEKEGLILKK